MRLEQMDSIPPNSNPFHHDLYHMGTAITKEWMIMHLGSGTKYLILVHCPTGARTKLWLEDLPEEEQEHLDALARMMNNAQRRA